MIVKNGVQGQEEVIRPSLQNSHTNLVGTVLADRYRLVKLIGEGGMGSVYQAEHITIGRKLAVKVLAPEYCDSPAVVERFIQEARTASMLHHEHIVDITDFGYTKNGLAFLTMEYLEGEDLATLLSREGKQPWARVRRMILQICRALDGAHAKGIIHRDMKPDNCFRIKRGGNHDFIKILDFGIAKVIADGQNPGRGDRPKMATEAGTLLGTPEYMAPEIARDQKADARVDVYSIGIVMYELLTGTVPFKGQTFMATVAMQMVDEPDPPRKRVPAAEIPEVIERIVLRALRKDPAERYQNIRELAEAIIDADRTLRYTSQGMPALAWETDDFESSSTSHPLLESSQRSIALSSGVSRPATTQLPVQQPVSSPSPPPTLAPEGDDEPGGPTRSNPYRVLAGLLLVVVFGLGIFVYYLLYVREHEAAPEIREVTPTIIPEPKVEEPKKEEPKVEEPKKSESKKGEGEEKSKKAGASGNTPSTEDERKEFFDGLLGDVSKCGAQHGIKGLVQTAISVEAGTGKLDPSLRSNHSPAFVDCVIKSMGKKRFKRGRQAFVYNADFTI